MAHPLDGCRLKLDRADEHLQALKAETLAYIERKPYRFSQGRSADHREHSFYLEATEPIPVRLSVLFGDVLQNARSALDHIAWQLASLEHVAPRRTTSFPICHDAESWKARRDQVADIGLIARAEIEQSQPYNRADGRPHELWVLNELARFDRHQTLNLVVAGISSGHFRFGRRDEAGHFHDGYKWPGGGLGFAFTPAFDDPTLVTRWIFPFSDPELEVRSNFKAGVFLRHHELGAQLPADGTGEAILRHIRQSLVPRFEPFFPVSSPVAS
jgi:hypothetical protein